LFSTWYQEPQTIHDLEEILVVVPLSQAVSL